MKYHIEEQTVIDRPENEYESKGWEKLHALLDDGWEPYQVDSHESNNRQYSTYHLRKQLS